MVSASSSSSSPTIAELRLFLFTTSSVKSETHTQAVSSLLQPAHLQTFREESNTLKLLLLLLTSVVVTLSVGQAVDLRPRAAAPGHPEEQRVGLDHVGIAGLKLAAGHQQGGERAGLGVGPAGGAGLRVQGDLLLPRRDLLHRAAHVLQEKNHLMRVKTL